MLNLKFLALTLIYVVIDCEELTDNDIIYAVSVRSTGNDIDFIELSRRGVKALIVKDFDFFNETDDKDAVDGLVVHAKELGMKLIFELMGFRDIKFFLEELKENFESFRYIDGYKLSFHNNEATEIDKCGILEPLVKDLSAYLIIIDNTDCDFKSSSLHYKLLKGINDESIGSSNSGFELDDEPRNPERFFNLIKILLPGFLIVESFQSFVELSEFLELRDSELFTKGAFRIAKPNSELIILTREIESGENFTVVGSFSFDVEVLKLELSQCKVTATSSKESKYSIGSWTEDNELELQPFEVIVLVKAACSYCEESKKNRPLALAVFASIFLIAVIYHTIGTFTTIIMI